MCSCRSAAMLVLFAALPAAQVAKLNGPLAQPTVGDVVDYLADPAQALVVFRANLSSPNVYELFSAPADGSAPALKLNDPLPAGANVGGATINVFGAPHVMPVWGVWWDGCLWFSTGGQTRKAVNIARDARCVATTERADEAVIVEGVAKEVRDKKRLAQLARPYRTKYTPWTLDTGLGPVYAVHPRVAFAMHESQFPRGATRWRF